MAWPQPWRKRADVGGKNAPEVDAPLSLRLELRPLVQTRPTIPMTRQAIPMMSTTIASVSVWMIASNVVILSCSRDRNWTTRNRREPACTAFPATGYVETAMDLIKTLAVPSANVYIVGGHCSPAEKISGWDVTIL